MLTSTHLEWQLHQPGIYELYCFPQFHFFSKLTFAMSNKVSMAKADEEAAEMKLWPEDAP